MIGDIRAVDANQEYLLAPANESSAKSCDKGVVKSASDLTTGLSGLDVVIVKTEKEGKARRPTC
jgi:hypothetical protein